MAIGTSSPPYITFEQRSVEDRTATLAVGGVQYKNINYVCICRPGEKDTVEKPADEWIEAIGRNPNFDPTLVMRFRAQYEMWKSGQEIPPNGTHMRMWGGASKAEQDMVLAANVRTVEDLAGVGEDVLRKFGPGARALQNKAKAYLQANNDTGKTAEELIALRVAVDQKDKSIEDLRSSIVALQAQVSAMQLMAQGGNVYGPGTVYDPAIVRAPTAVDDFLTA